MIITYVQGKSFHTWEVLNLGSIAALVKKEFPDIEQRFVSGFFESDEEIISACLDADFVGFSATSPQMDHSRRIADSVRTKNCKAKFVLGGFHASSVAQECLEEIGVNGKPRWDFVVKGEGEQAMVDILKGETRRLIERQYVLDLDTLPFPDRKLMLQERQCLRSERLFQRRAGSIFQTRGCPFSCTFCASRAVWGKKQRTRSARNTLDEIKSLVNNYGIDFLMFADDESGIYRDQWMEFCDFKRKELPSLKFGCNVVASTIITWNGKQSDHILRKMKEAGCSSIWIGVESGSPGIMASTKKPITMEKVRTCFKMAKDLEIERRAYMLLGMPNETEETIQESESFVDEIDPDIIGWTILAPYPGSDFYDPKKHKEWPWNSIDEFGNTYWRTEALSNARLRWHQKRLTDKYKERVTWHQKHEEELNPAVAVKQEAGRSGF